MLAGGPHGGGPTAPLRPTAAAPPPHPLRSAYFGDLHVHTRYSFDAYIFDVRATPDDAYRYARGEVIGTQPYDEEGRPMDHLQLRRPLRL